MALLLGARTAWLTRRSWSLGTASSPQPLSAKVAPAPRTERTAPCVGQAPSNLQFELVVEDPAIRLLFGMDTPPLRARGLGVQLRQRNVSESEFVPHVHPRCTDATATQVKEVANAQRLLKGYVSHVGGVVIVQSTDELAGHALFATDLHEAVAPKGEVVAFAASENLVVFADSADPEAVTAAAREATSRIDVTGELGCALIEPVILTGDAWHRWEHPLASAELAAWERAARECSRALLRDLLIQSDRGRAEPALPATFVPREYDDESGSEAFLEPAVPGAPPRLLVTADRARIIRTDGSFVSMPWQDFVARAGGALQPVSLAGKPMAEAFVVDPVAIAALAQ
jgi:hypothetical protein